jgi:C4-dicarboxylate-specific signal transduction histidine kinase
VPPAQGLALISADPRAYAGLLAVMPEPLQLRTQAGVLGPDGPWLVLQVKDTGPGLPEAVRRQSFSPVLSRKGGRHQGLGLAVAGQLTREPGARIHCPLLLPGATADP